MNELKNTLIIRHNRENLKKCSLSGLESRKDLSFFSYPNPPLPPLEGYFLLSIEGEPLSEKDHSMGLLLVDATWRLAKKIISALKLDQRLPTRKLPPHFQTAYPRRQADCPEPSEGLASIEALVVAYELLGKDPEGLMDHYYWKELFLQKNPQLLRR